VQKQIHVALGIVCYKNGQSVQILVTRRPDDAPLGGLWEFPGGKVHKGELPQNAVKRELAEEVGIQVQPVIALCEVQHVYEHAHVHLHAWLCQQVGGDVENIQVSDSKWVKLEKVNTVTFPPANEDIVRQLMSIDFSHWPDI